MINPGANTTVASSAIDSSATGQTLANGVVPTLDGAGQITVIAGDVGEDFVSPRRVASASTASQGRRSAQAAIQPEISLTARWRPPPSARTQAFGSSTRTTARAAEASPTVDPMLVCFPDGDRAPLGLSEELCKRRDLIGPHAANAGADLVSYSPHRLRPHRLNPLRAPAACPGSGATHRHVRSSGAEPHRRISPVARSGAKRTYRRGRRRLRTLITGEVQTVQRA